MENKAQGAIEYLLIIGAAIIVVAIVIIMMTGILNSTSEQSDAGQSAVESGFDELGNRLP